eukprot:TRINITY_DN6601_c1_g1_i2.p1 TRINITY_DN6601_c1_g1~~TRINITY_DN6601_c1_g1_i2.p1  ORF type:complete len:408 (+),score=173.35 TRINITY_DN6601_c1_g1_i2:48-1271(+)
MATQESEHKLLIKILEARNVAISANTYCKVYIDKEKKLKTLVQYKGNTSVYEDTARAISIHPDKSSSLIKFACWSKKLFNEEIGECTTPLSNHLDGVPRDEWLKLIKKGKEIGELHVQILYLAPGDELTKNLDEFSAPLQTLIRKNKFEILKKAVEVIPQNIETIDKEGNLPLHVACLVNQPQSVALLLQKGANPKGLNSKEIHPAHFAASHSPNSLTTLHEKGADLNASDSSGKKPIHYASANANDNGVRALADLGANINAQDSDGNTALHCCLLDKDPSFPVLQSLYQKGADVYLANLLNLSCAQLCADDQRVTENAKKRFLKACGVIDDREFEVRKQLRLVKYVEGKDLVGPKRDGKESWYDNTQWAITPKPGTKLIKILMQHSLLIILFFLMVKLIMLKDIMI